MVLLLYIKVKVKNLLKKTCFLLPLHAIFIDFLPDGLRVELHVSDSASSIILLFQDTSLCIITYTSGHSRIWDHGP